MGERVNVEIKAIARNLGEIRKSVRALGPAYVGTFRQVDTYLKVAKGRLKLREWVDGEGGELVYYDRENVPRPKRSRVTIAAVSEPRGVKEILERGLGVMVVVEKVREIYRYKGTQIHLDTVKGLGTFVELEREVEDDVHALQEGEKELNRLMKRLGIADKDLLIGSYSDLLQPEPPSR
ncbi:MAG: class IV adenylate cyclase [Candidatus Bathyarchaeia archaeon]